MKHNRMVLFGLIVIGIIVDLIKGFRYLAKDPEARNLSANFSIFV